MRISDWSSDVCSSDLLFRHRPARRAIGRLRWLPPTAWSGGTTDRLLVLAEQGLGDELLFASCWEDLAALVRQGRLRSVRIEVDGRLRPLAARTFPELGWIDRDRRDRKSTRLNSSH